MISCKGLVREFGVITPMMMILMGSATPATAQDDATQAAQGGLGDIVVTARRTEESLLDVPIAISALTSDNIEARGIKNLDQLSDYTPGLFISPDPIVTSGRNDRSNRRYTFRGLSVASGGLFINGAPYSGSSVPDATDAARIEVLKGPQSVYFGRSTYSGAINFVTKDPSASFGGQVDAEAASYGKYDGRISIEGPILGDQLTARASVRRYHTNGQYKNGTTGRRLGEQDSLNATFAFTAKPSDQFTVRGYYAYNRDEDGASVVASLKNAGTGPVLSCALGGTGRNYYCGGIGNVSKLPSSYISYDDNLTPFLSQEFTQNARGRPDLLFDSDYLDHFGLKQEMHFGSLRADYETDSGWVFGVIGSYSYTRKAILSSFNGRDLSSIANPYYITDATARATACAAAAASCYRTPYMSFNIGGQIEYEEYFTEGRITSPEDKAVRGTLGVSYYEMARPGGEPAWFLSPVGRGNNANASYGSRTPAVFGGVYVDPLPGLTVSLEGRYQWDQIRQQQTYPTTGMAFKNTWTSFSPRVSVDYKITPATMAYATFARGYRQGGFNTSLAALSATDVALIQQQAPDAAINFDQERLDNYEVGLKGAWFNNRLRATLSLYYMEWLNGQVSNQVFGIRPDNSTVGAVVTLNQGKVEMKGVELEGAFAVTSKFLIEGTLQFADNVIKDYVFTDGLKIRNSTDVEGNQLDQSPKWAWTISPSYQDGLSGDWDWFGRVDYRHRGRIFVDPTNVAWLNARDVFNLRIGVSNKSDGLRIEAYVNNLFNDDTITAAIRGNDTAYALSGGAVVPGLALSLNELRLGLPEKREFGLRVSKKF